MVANSESIQWNVHTQTGEVRWIASRTSEPPVPVFLLPFEDSHDFTAALTTAQSFLASALEQRPVTNRPTAPVTYTPAAGEVLAGDVELKARVDAIVEMARKEPRIGPAPARITARFDEEKGNLMRLSLMFEVPGLALAMRDDIADRVMDEAGVGPDEPILVSIRSP